ncbi:unnamed protein product, partial [Sphacelaria rigidula]
RCLRPTDARHKDGPGVTVPSHDLESPTGEFVLGEGSVSRHGARGSSCSRRCYLQKGAVSCATKWGFALPGSVPAGGGPSFDRPSLRRTSVERPTSLNTLSEEVTAGTTAGSMPGSVVDLPNHVKPFSPSHCTGTARAARDVLTGSS